MSHNHEKNYSNESSNAKRQLGHFSFDKIGNNNTISVNGTNNTIMNGVFIINHGYPDSKSSNGIGIVLKILLFTLIYFDYDYYANITKKTPRTGI